MLQNEKNEDGRIEISADGPSTDGGKLNGTFYLNVDRSIHNIALTATEPLEEILITIHETSEITQRERGASLLAAYQYLQSSLAIAAS